MNAKGKIDKNLYNEKSLYLLNIRQLRDIGRKIGVPAPATLKKQQLVDYILKIVYGEIEPPKRNSCGRPNVRDVNIDEYMAKIAKKTDVNGELISASFDDLGIFKVASHDDNRVINGIKQKVFVEENKKYYLREHAFVPSKDDIEVPLEIQKKYNLTAFDVLEIVSSGKLFKIISINGNKVKDEKQAKKLKKLKIGEKQVFHLRTKEEVNLEIINTIKESLNAGLKVVVLSGKTYVDDKNVQYLIVDQNQNNSQKYKKINEFISVCEKFVYNGENIVVVTDKSDLVEGVIDSFESDVSLRIKKHLQNKIDELLDLGNVLAIFKLDADFIYQ